MKKIILAVAALLVAVGAFAQDYASSYAGAGTSRSGIHFGIMAGVTSTASDVKSAWAEASDITQYHVGAALKMSIGGILVFQPAVLYNVKGAKISDQDDDFNDFKADYKTGFIEVPLQIQAGIPIGDALRIYGIAEPFVGYAIYNQAKSELTAGADTETEEKNNWDNVKSRLEYGLGFGAGVEIMNNVQLSVRYFWNLGKIYADKDVEVDPNGGGNNAVNTIKHEKCSGIMASLGIFF